MEFNKKDTLIILIGGKARSGKGTLAGNLEKLFRDKGLVVVNSPYTKYLKMYIENITGKKIDDDNKPRDMLQEISSGLIKGVMGKEDIFIERQLEDIEIYSYFADVIIVSDVRFPDEFSEVKRKFSNVLSIVVSRIDYVSELTEKQRKDVTEISLDNYIDYDISVVNDGIDTLETRAKEIFDQVMERR